MSDCFNTAVHTTLRNETLLQLNLYIQLGLHSGLFEGMSGRGQSVVRFGMPSIFSHKHSAIRSMVAVSCHTG
jgi:hypothetical protein